MADQFPGADEGGEAQDVCSFIGSIINQRQSVERLINWLRNSQATCTDSYCSDELGNLLDLERRAPVEADQVDSCDTDPFAIVMLFVVGMLTLYAMSLARDRESQRAKVGKVNQSHHSGNDPDDSHHQYRRNNGDDNGRPAI